MHIRNTPLEIGDVVYVYDTQLGQVRFGNIEEIDVQSNNASVSFSRPERAKRHVATSYPENEILLVGEMGSATKESGFKDADLVLVVQEVSFATPYIVVGDHADGSPVVTVRKALYVAGTGWTAVGAVISIEGQPIYKPWTLAVFMKWRYARPVDPIFDILIDPVGEKFDSQEAAALVIDGIRVPVTAHLSIDDHKTNLRLHCKSGIASAVLDVVPEKLIDEVVVPADSAPLDWNAAVAVSGGNLSWNVDLGDSGYVDVHIKRLSISYGDDSVLVTRDVYVGAPIGVWSHQLLEREPTIHPILGNYGQPASTLQFMAFGARMLIYTPRQHGSEMNPYTAVVRVGAPLGDEQHAVLSAFLGYISGGRCVNVLTETYTLDSKIKKEFVNRGAPTKRRLFPIPLESPTGDVRFVSEELPGVLKTFERWREADLRSFEAVFHHFAEGVDSNYPTTRILRLAVALESFINLVTGDSAENENIIDPDDFEALRNGLKKTLFDYAALNPEAVGTAEAERYATKIDYLNQASNTKRMKRFWELIKIKQSKADEKLIRRLRNQSVHQGYVGEESSAEGILSNAEDADRLADILNRAILAYAGYSGPVLSAVSGTWINAISGGAFSLPVPLAAPAAQPRPDHFGVEITTTTKAMTTDESVALDALRKIGRSAARASGPEAKVSQPAESQAQNGENLSA